MTNQKTYHWLNDHTYDKKASLILKCITHALIMQHLEIDFIRETYLKLQAKPNISLFGLMQDYIISISPKLTHKRSTLKAITTAALHFMSTHQGISKSQV